MVQKDGEQLRYRNFHMRMESDGIIRMATKWTSQQFFTANGDWRVWQWKTEKSNQRLISVLCTFDIELFII